MKKLFWIFLGFIGAFLAHKILHFFLNPNYQNKGFFSSDLLLVVFLVIFFLIAKRGWTSGVSTRNSKYKSYFDLFNDFSLKILDLANVEQTEANKLKAIAYIYIAQVAILHVISKGKTNVFVDAMVSEAVDTIASIKVKIKDLANDKNELKELLKFFPPAAKLSGNATIEGKAGFNAICTQFGKDLTFDIANHTDGPLGVHGYAAIVVLEGLRGEGNGVDGIIEVSSMLLEMTGEIFHI